MENKTYECAICFNINHISKFHCSTCNTIPSCYSVINSPAIFHYDELGLPHLIPVVIAHGADRAEWHRASRAYLRTVKVDYYAAE